MAVNSPIPLLTDTTPQGLLNWALKVAQWASGVETDLNALGAPTGAGTAAAASTPDPHLPWVILSGNYSYTLTDVQVGLVNIELSGLTGSSYTINLPAPVAGAWFDLQIRAVVNSGSPQVLVKDQTANTLMDWTLGGGTLHRWVRCQVQDNSGTLQWTLYIARAWTGDTPPTLT